MNLLLSLRHYIMWAASFSCGCDTSKVVVSVKYELFVQICAALRRKGECYSVDGKGTSFYELKFDGASVVTGVIPASYIREKADHCNFFEFGGPL